MSDTVCGEPHAPVFSCVLAVKPKVPLHFAGGEVTWSRVDDVEEILWFMLKGHV